MIMTVMEKTKDVKGKYEILVDNGLHIYIECPW